MNDYLEHHGIKGQKWGIRRFQREDGTRTEAGKKRYRSDEYKRGLAIATCKGGLIGRALYKRKHKETDEPSRHSYRERKAMSDDELFKRIGRLEKEKRLMDLERDTDDRARAQTNRILATAGKTALAATATGAAMLGTKHAIRVGANILGKDGDKLIENLFPKKKKK